MAEPDDPAVYYINAGPGEANYYNPVTNSIVLDETLKEYPLAHHRVLTHEVGHHEIGSSFIENLLYELRNDIELAFSESDAVEQYREYEAERTFDRGDLKRMVLCGVANGLRSGWTLLLYPLGQTYRWVKRRLL